MMKGDIINSDKRAPSSPKDDNKSLNSPKSSPIKSIIRSSKYSPYKNDRTRPSISVSIFSEETRDDINEKDSESCGDSVSSSGFTSVGTGFSSVGTALTYGTVATPASFKNYMELKSTNLSLKSDNMSLKMELKRVRTRMDAVQSSSKMRLLALEHKMREKTDQLHERVVKDQQKPSSMEVDGRLKAIKALREATIRQEKKIKAYRYKLRQSREDSHKRDEMILSLEKEVTKLKLEAENDLSEKVDEIKQLQERLVAETSLDTSNISTPSDVTKELNDSFNLLNISKQSISFSEEHTSQNYYLQNELNEKTKQIMDLELNLEEAKEELEDERMQRSHDNTTTKEQLTMRNSGEIDRLRKSAFVDLETSRMRVLELERLCEVHERELSFRNKEIERLNELLGEHQETEEENFLNDGSFISLDGGYPISPKSGLVAILEEGEDEDYEDDEGRTQRTTSTSAATPTSSIDSGSTNDNISNGIMKAVRFAFFSDKKKKEDGSFVYTSTTKHSSSSIEDEYLEHTSSITKNAGVLHKFNFRPSKNKKKKKGEKKVKRNKVIKITA